ncbi:hypothetical protein POSPLADRAFT_1051478 [Postia placenta MAD-698-R-SB12]|uniref:Arrestin C-terminal-like domain-containing protein n=1 Tax=Postia placenta MAD-698-R-SB12 TaxID=670580 RepID=A0A1X6NG59_9APHY|nr:hypothetical protein POSPLADRAFT_1051478 [Postia placenta MAD-698-R-SB12]OSX67333.1 hypothetical protein POSPLADRAFT_1051478 [Postia placenta MAD-698-R-SB12]
MAGLGIALADCQPSVPSDYQTSSSQLSSSDDPSEPTSRFSGTTLQDLETTPSHSDISSVRSSHFTNGDNSGVDHGRANVASFAPGILGPLVSQDYPSPSEGNAAQSGFVRSNTLHNFRESQTRNASDLRLLMGNANARLKSGAVVRPTHSRQPCGAVDRDPLADPVSLEQAKSRARIDVDIVLESNACVQGDFLRGYVKLRVRKRSRKELPMLLAGGKVRVVGFECIPSQDERHTFYQCASPLSEITDQLHRIYEKPAGADGFAPAIEGVHVLPFAMRLPADGTCGTPKGVLSVHSGVAVQYVAMVSIKVKNPKNGKRSIAHFYRHCEIWPRLSPSVVLLPAARPLQSATSKSLSMLGSANKVKLTGLLHRLTWVAGQRCYVTVAVVNETKKTIRTLTLTLIRSTTIFKPKPALDTGNARTLDPDSCQTTTMHKVLAETFLQMAHRGTKGHASAKGWWTGVAPGQELTFSHYILLPPEALSVTRNRLLEVEYIIRITLSAGSLTPDIHVTLPIRIINFLSIDPIPRDPTQSSSGAHVRPLQRRRSIDGSLDARNVASNCWPTSKQHGPPGTLHSRSSTLYTHGDGDEDFLRLLQPPQRSHISKRLPHKPSAQLHVMNPDTCSESSLIVTEPNEPEHSDDSVYSSGFSSHPASMDSLASSSEADFGATDLDDANSDEEVGRVVESTQLDLDEDEDTATSTIAGPEYGACARKVSVPRPSGPRVGGLLKPGSKQYREAHRRMLDALNRDGSVTRHPQTQDSEQRVAMTSCVPRAQGRTDYVAAVADYASAGLSRSHGMPEDPALDGPGASAATEHVGDGGDVTPKIAHVSATEMHAVPQIAIQPLRPARHPNRMIPVKLPGPSMEPSAGAEYTIGQAFGCPHLYGEDEPFPPSVRGSRRLPNPPTSILGSDLPPSVSDLHVAPATQDNSDGPASNQYAVMSAAVRGTSSGCTPTDDSAPAPASVLAKPHAQMSDRAQQPTSLDISSATRGGMCEPTSTATLARIPNAHLGLNHDPSRQPELDRTYGQPHASLGQDLADAGRPSANMRRTSTSQSGSSTSSGVRERIAELEVRVQSACKDGSAYV